MENQNSKKKTFIIIISCICAFFFFIFMILAFVLFSKVGLLSGSKIELTKAEGTVTILNNKEKNVKIKDGLKLHDGYNVDTSIKSFAYLGLDKKRLVKMGENTNANIIGNGKKLTIDLKQGNLFFNIEKKLKNNESFTITTSTMTMGIRGTAGYVTVYNENHALFSVLEGKVECMVYNPQTYEISSATVEGGQQIEITISSDGTVTILPTKIVEKSIPDFVKVEIVKNQTLQTRIQTENNGLNVNTIIQNAPETVIAETDNSSQDQFSYSDLKNAKVGDIVTFGSYPQSSNGINKDLIEWYVIEKSGKNALLLSKYILDAQMYDSNVEECTWETSTLRAWLNNDFLNEAFTAKEQTYIVDRTVDQVSHFGYPVTGGNTTFEKVHLLSAQDLDFILGVPVLTGNKLDADTGRDFYNRNPIIVAKATPYAVSRGKIQESFKQSELTGDTSYHQGMSPYWLRINSGLRADTVSSMGFVRTDTLTGTISGVRPVIYVKFE